MIGKVRFESFWPCPSAVGDSVHVQSLSCVRRVEEYAEHAPTVATSTCTSSGLAAIAAIHERMSVLTLEFDRRCGTA